jgi:hypothetical protein
MLLELKDSLLLVNGVDDLRKDFVLNPVDQGDQMGAYAKKAVSYTTQPIHISIHLINTIYVIS